MKSNESEKKGSLTGMNTNGIDLKVGTKIKLGEEFCKQSNGVYRPGEIIELIQGYFDYDNGLYCETQTAPSIWDDDLKEFESIYHLFENDLSGFLDCEILNEVK